MSQILNQILFIEAVYYLLFLQLVCFIVILFLQNLEYSDLLLYLCLR